MTPDWLPPLERELKHKVDLVWHTLPESVWRSNPAGPGTCILRRFLVCVLDEALSRVNSREQQVVEAIEEVQRLLERGGTTAEWEAAWARDAGAARTGAWTTAEWEAARAADWADWAAEGAVEMEADGNAARAVAWATARAAGSASKGRMAKALDSAITATVRGTPEGQRWLAENITGASEGSVLRDFYDDLTETELVKLDALLLEVA